MNKLVTSNIQKAVAGTPLAYALARNKNLYQAVACLPNGGINGKIVPRKWLARGYKDSYYLVKEAKLERENTRGVVKGILVWKGEEKKSVQKLEAALKTFWEPIL